MLITSCNPLTIFWHDEGLARFATQEYSFEHKAPEKGDKKVDYNQAQFAHLTNYAINKDSESYKMKDKDIATGRSSKRTIQTVYDRLEKNGVDIHLLKLKIADLIIKTLMAIQPDLIHNYRMCQPNDRTF